MNRTKKKKIYRKLIFYLEKKENDSKQTNPTMKGVHVWDVISVVKIKHCHQSNHCKNHYEYLDTHVDKFGMELDNHR